MTGGGNEIRDATHALRRAGSGQRLSSRRSDSSGVVSVDERKPRTSTRASAAIPGVSTNSEPFAECSGVAWISRRRRKVSADVTYVRPAPRYAPHDTPPIVG